MLSSINVVIIKVILSNRYLTL